MSILVINEDGLHRKAEYRPSCNHDLRPEDVTVDTLVIHAISLPPNQYGGCFVEDFFCNQLNISEHPYFEEIKGLNVSSHFYIKRTGELFQFVPVDMRAWHAGVSSFQGRERVNDFSVGIELEGCDDDPFEEAQYETLVALCQDLMAYFPGISENRITGHSDIAPGRKTDPGPHFNWQHFRDQLADRSTS